MEIVVMGGFMMKNAILLYDFYQVNSTIIADMTPTGAAGVIRNYDAGGAEIFTDSIYGKEVRAISLPGGEDGGYVQLPDGILKSTSGVTVSCWCRINDVNGEAALWSFGEDNGFYLNMYSMEDSNKILLRPCVTSGGRSQEASIDKEVIIKPGKWHMITVTLEGGELPCNLSIYVDGIHAATVLQRRVSADMLSDASFNCIGMGAQANAPCNCDVAKFEVFNYDMNSDEVYELFDVSDDGKITADMEQLNLPETISEDIVLPLECTYGSTIHWESSYEEVLSSTGKVNRPKVGSPNVQVVLTAEFKNGSSTHKKEFIVTVEALPTFEMLLKSDLNAIEIEDLQGIYENISLPTHGASGSSIKWSSSRPEIISPDGKVNRPAAGSSSVTVVLTAEGHLNGVTAIKEFIATVLPIYEDNSISQVMPVILYTEAGLPPTLPTKVMVEYSDGSCQEDVVIWDCIDPSLYQSQGNFTCEGKLKDNGFKVTAIVYVMDASGNILPKGYNAPLQDVSINGDNLFTQNARRCLDYLKLLDADRMLYNFRSTFGQDTKGAKPLGGWDEPKGLLRGHSTGHYLSALALAYASTGDIEIKEKMDYMISVLKDLQSLSKGRPQDFKTACTPTSAGQSLWSKDPSTWGEGFLSAYSPDQFALLEQFTPYATIWAPYYTLHKLLAGFIDCYMYGGNMDALEVAKGIGTWATERLSSVDYETRAKMWSMYIAGEYGGMNESLARLALITGDKKYLDGAKMFDNPKVFNGLAEGKDTLSGIHVNQHIPQAIGAMYEYKATGDKKYYFVGKYYWDISVNHYCYSIGGLGRGEVYKEPDILAGNIESDRNCETCAAYNMLKLTKDLYSYDPENAAYMDYYERTLINQIASSQNPVISPNMHHGVTYMLPIGPGQKKSYSNDYDDFTCCHGTGMENHVKYQEAAYFLLNDNNTLYVNLYMPSKMQWKEKGVTIHQMQPFPSEKVWMKVEGNGDFTIKLRIPYWAGKKARVKVNGESVSEKLLPSSYLTLNRSWKDGDMIEMELPYSIHIDKTQDNLLCKTVGSIMYGPLVMVAKSNRKNFLTLNLAPNAEENFETFMDENSSTVELKYQGITFIPMYKAHGINYHAYFFINHI